MDHPPLLLHSSGPETAPILRVEAIVTATSRPPSILLPWERSAGLKVENTRNLSRSCSLFPSAKKLRLHIKGVGRSRLHRIYPDGHFKKFSYPMDPKSNAVCIRARSHDPRRTRCEESLGRASLCCCLHIDVIVAVIIILTAAYALIPLSWLFSC